MAIGVEDPVTFGNTAVGISEGAERESQKGLLDFLAGEELETRLVRQCQSRTNGECSRCCDESISSDTDPGVQAGQ